jgi:hypothetical protein
VGVFILSCVRRWLTCCKSYFINVLRWKSSWSLLYGRAAPRLEIRNDRERYLKQYSQQMIKNITMIKILSQHCTTILITLILFSAMILACTSSVCMGDMIYNIVDYGQNGAKMEGTITTNGDYGTLTNSDITNFNITMTPAPGSPYSAYTLTPSTPAYVSCNSLQADSSSLYLTPGAGHAFNIWSHSGYVCNLEYDDTSSPPWTSNDVLIVKDYNGYLLFTVNAYYGPIGYNPMIIAAVPEPATLVLLSIAMSIILFRKWRDD